jgi:hypothetical protein
MMEGLASLLGVLIAGALLGIEVWVVGVGVLAWVVARHGAILPHVLIVAALFLGFSAIAYVAAVVLIGILIDAMV